MNPERERLVDEALCAQKSIFAALRVDETLAVLQMDVTMAQLKGLSSLAHRGTLTIGQLADELRIGRPAASILADRLVQLELVERTEDTDDRRRTFVRLNARGEELVTGLRQGGRERMRDWVGRLSDEDLAALVRGLHALAAVASSD